MSASRLYLPLGIVLAFVIAALLNPNAYGFDPIATNLRERLLPPGSRLQSGEWALLGTDNLGRNMLPQVIYGARVSLAVAFSTVMLGGSVGAIIGIVSGYFGGVRDTAIMRLADIQLSIPPVLLAILLVSVLEPGLGTMILALSITRWVIFARVARSVALVARARPFVDAAKVAGLADWQILLYHIVPFMVGPILVIATVQFGLVILTEAGLSFLGLGTSLQQPSWGLTIANGRAYLISAWWISTFPGVALSAVVVSIALIGDELRDRLDPVMRGR